MSGRLKTAETVVIYINGEQKSCHWTRLEETYTFVHALQTANRNGNITPSTKVVKY